MFKLPADFTGFASRADGSAGLRFATNELSPEDFAALKAHHNQHGWLLFKENDISESDIPEGNADEEGISPSERLRRVLFVYWKDKVNEGDFDTWRRKQMEKLIEHYKSKLD